MSDQQIKQILERLGSQDVQLDAIQKQLRELDPVKDAFNNVMGFDRVLVYVLKFLAILGAGVGIIYTFISWIKE